jgi:hypothetical protein
MSGVEPVLEGRGEEGQDGDLKETLFGLEHGWLVARGRLGNFYYTL